MNINMCLIVNLLGIRDLLKGSQSETKRKYKGNITHFVIIFGCNYNEVNNSFTGWAFAHQVNYFDHQVN